MTIAIALSPLLVVGFGVIASRLNDVGLPYSGMARQQQTQNLRMTKHGIPAFALALTAWLRHGFEPQ